MADVMRIGFIGAGRMATALAQGWIGAGLTQRESCMASDPVPAVREQFVAATGAKATSDNSAVISISDVVVIAVKPQNISEVMAEICTHITPQHLIISIAAGITLQRLADGLGEEKRIIRVMPNTACIVQASAAAYSANKSATPRDIALVDRLLNVVGRAFAVPEKLLNAVTGLSGSGPAFVYTVIEALSDGGVLMGLPRDVATTLAAQTVFGAAKMVLDTNQHPGVLKDQVTSPGGTTIAGIQALERGGLRAGLIDAVEAATKRSIELGNQ